MIEGKSFYGSYGSMTIWEMPSLRNIWMIEVSDSEYCHRGSVQVAKEVGEILTRILKGMIDEVERSRSIEESQRHTINALLYENKCLKEKIEKMEASE